MRGPCAYRQKCWPSGLVACFASTTVFETNTIIISVQERDSRVRVGQRAPSTWLFAKSCKYGRESKSKHP